MRRMLLIFVFMGLLVGCSNNDSQSPAYVVIREAELNTGDTVPAPTGEVVLTIMGNINNTNVEDTLQFDIETLERLGVIEYSVNDEQAEGEVVTFQGVLLRDILAIAEVAEGATNLNTVALNDYAIDIPITDAQEYPVIVATSVNGERMTVERYGPTRIVYPYDSFEFDSVTYDPRWIWQLRDIVVE